MLAVAIQPTVRMDFEACLYSIPEAQLSCCEILPKFGKQFGATLGVSLDLKVYHPLVALLGVNISETMAAFLDPKTQCSNLEAQMPLVCSCY